ncbi:MAG: hypothetical protein K1X79_02385 [Oligoflexia bacterium]|nr:hypothetical protein [Oligoflexia bacterium]
MPGTRVYWFIGLLLALQLISGGVSSAQVAPTPPLAWTSEFSIPFFTKKVDGSAGAKKLKQLCEDKSDSAQSMFKDILSEYWLAAANYCSKLDHFYFNTDIFGQLCLVTERYYPISEEAGLDPETGTVDCDKLSAFFEQTFSGATMEGNEVTLFPLPDKSFCAPQISAQCLLRVYPALN